MVRSRFVGRRRHGRLQEGPPVNHQVSASGLVGAGPPRNWIRTCAYLILFSSEFVVMTSPKVLEIPHGSQPRLRWPERACLSFLSQFHYGCIREEIRRGARWRQSDTCLADQGQKGCRGWRRRGTIDSHQPLRPLVAVFVLTTYTFINRSLPVASSTASTPMRS